MRRLAIVTLALAALAACGSKEPEVPVGTSHKDRAPITHDEVGVWAFDSIDARPVSADALRGKPTVLAFVTTDTLPSQAQVNFLLAMAKNDGDKVNYALVAVQPARDRELVVVVTGSAVGAVRALLDVRTAVAAPVTHLYLGVRDATDPPLPDELARWARSGAHVTLCASSNGDPHDGLDVRVGYAQRVCASDLAAGLAPAGVIFAAGHEEIFADLEGPRGERPLYGNV